MATLAGFLLFFTTLGNHATATRADSTVIEGTYNVEITELPVVPHFLAGFFGKVAQWLELAPDRLEYRETIFDSVARDDFRIELKDQTGRQWIRISSDTTVPSFIDPPKFRTGKLSKIELKPDVIRSIADIREFFERGQDYFFHSRFALWKDTVDFYSIRDSLRPLLYRFSSFNQKGELFMRGTVLRVDRDGFAVYPWTSLYLYKEGMGLILELQSLEIK